MTLWIVLLSTPATPPTSFCSRDWMMPVLVLVKNPSSIACRCENSRMRSAPITLLPTLGGQIGLPHAEGAGRDPERHHDGDQLDQHRHVGQRAPLVGEQPAVERLLGQQRRRDAEAGADQHEHDRDDELRLVRARTATPMRGSRSGIFGASAFAAFCAAASASLTRPPPRPPPPPRMLMARRYPAPPARAAGSRTQEIRSAPGVLARMAGDLLICDAGSSREGPLASQAQPFVDPASRPRTK